MSHAGLQRVSKRAETTRSRREKNRLEILGKLDNAALHADCDGVCPIVRTEFRQDVLDASLDGLLGDGELMANLLVGVPASNQSQDVYFRFGQSIVSGMFREFVQIAGDIVFLPAWTARIVSKSSLFTMFLSKYPLAPACRARSAWASPA